ncbi:MAG: hypothetical protein IT453_16085 [Planctomycetes bacterium]|nr:hypothetical protein [Planctomycetota bacterium]
MDFLLECIGFPPDHDFDGLAHAARGHAEPVAWRGPAGEHLRMPLGHGLELRMDREREAAPWTLYPHFQSNHRLRVAITDLVGIPDSPYDVILHGWANPPVDGDPRLAPDSYPIAAVITDARRLPRRLEVGHVLAVTLAGFALDVEYSGPFDPKRPVRGRRLDDGAWIGPLGGGDAPGGCVELSLPVTARRALENPVTRAAVELIEVELPGRPLALFASPWQLAVDGLATPRVGWRLEGTFLLTGRVAGGLASPTERLGSHFG